MTRGVPAHQDDLQPVLSGEGIRAHCHHLPCSKCKWETFPANNDPPTRDSSDRERSHSLQNVRQRVFLPTPPSHSQFECWRGFVPTTTTPLARNASGRLWLPITTLPLMFRAMEGICARHHLFPHSKFEWKGLWRRHHHHFPTNCCPF